MKKTKYGSKKTTTESGAKFHSKLEAKVYETLVDFLQKINQAQNLDLKLRLQYPFDLIEGLENFKTVRYRADFAILERDKIVAVVEAKGMMLPDAALKIKLFLSKNPELANCFILVPANETVLANYPEGFQALSVLIDELPLILSQLLCARAKRGD